jgi:predicted branched-subunit amino acid permease/branched-subunit amino acid transport protein
MAVTFDTSLSAGSGKDIIILNKAFRKGVLQGIPIALSVSFGFGILAVRAGLSIPAAVAISVTNVTSAGQAAGVGVIAAGGSYLEMALTQLTINFRYALMGFSLSQKLDEKFHLPQRMTTAFGITDEIFAVASSQPGMICPAYLYGLIAIAFLGWVLGTLLGAAAGQILPKFIIDAMGIVLYGMFLAIIVPVARKKKSVLTVVILAALCSILGSLQRIRHHSVCGAGVGSRGDLFPHSGGGANMSLILYIAIMAGVTYLIRVVPFTVFRKKIQNHFLQSFLYYIPYAVLSAMTIPAIFYSTGSMVTAAVGTVVAVVLAYFNLPLIVVALAASAAALVTGFLV